jgi:adenylate kinase
MECFENLIVMGKSGAGKQPRIDVLVNEYGLMQLSTGDIFRHYLGCLEAFGYTGRLTAFIDESTSEFISDEEIKSQLGIGSHADADSIVLGLKATYFVNSGKFVPDAITNALFDAAFTASGFRGVVLDGFPRTVDQARYLCGRAREEAVRFDAIILVENDDEMIVSRTVGRRICPVCKTVYHVEHAPPCRRGFCTQSACDQVSVIRRSDDTAEKIRMRLQEYHIKAVPALAYLKEQGIPVHNIQGNLPVFSEAAVRASVLDITEGLERR